MNDLIDKVVVDIELLRKVSAPITQKDVVELELIKRLQVANKTAWIEGAGVAAIQIGIPLRFAWYSIPKGKQGVLFNPVILKKWGSAIQKEGCLSLPHTWLDVERATTIEYTSNGKKKKANGFEARLIQHEIDHMDGILIIDKHKNQNELLLP